MKKLSLISLLLLILGLISSCDTKDAPLKKALKADALTRGEKYELLDYRFVESVLISTIEDSISSVRSLISINERRIETDSTRLISLYSERRDCQSLKASTIPLLAGRWNSLIRDYDKMIIKAETNIESAKIIIKNSREKISHFEEILTHAEDPIAYYLYYHSYRLDGKVCEDEVLLTPQNEIIK